MSLNSTRWIDNNASMWVNTTTSKWIPKLATNISGKLIMCVSEFKPFQVIFKNKFINQLLITSKKPIDVDFNSNK